MTETMKILNEKDLSHLLGGGGAGPGDPPDPPDIPPVD
jgi:hypothetical protein